MKVENPSKCPMLVCRVEDCLAHEFVAVMSLQFSYGTDTGLRAGTDLPVGWQHDPTLGFVCPRHAQNGEPKLKPMSMFNNTGDSCSECGSINLVPAGRCMRCNDCGGSTGCG